MDDGTLNSSGIAGSPAGTRIVVAMSGGVDSSVVAGLLKREGYDVIGITLQLYDHGAAIRRAGSCCAGQDIHDARRVAAKFDIPHYVLDYEARFKAAVIDPFAQSYERGETPVPCIACNQTVKFSDLMALARSLDADAMATGHYVRSRLSGGRRALFRPVDASRDQSYFLFSTTRAQLEFLRFPLGEMTKARVRQLAQEFGLDIADKPDSQDICFVARGRYSDIVEKLRPSAGRAGDIVHLDGRVLGRHEGVFRYTVGQRRGLKIGGGEPLYVVRINAPGAQIIVGPRAALYQRHIALRDVNWIGDPAVFAAHMPHCTLRCHVRLRSSQQPVPALLVREEDMSWRIELNEGEQGAAPGQACVFYDSPQDDAQILGGGWITRSAATRTQLITERARGQDPAPALASA